MEEEIYSYLSQLYFCVSEYIKSNGNWNFAIRLTNPSLYAITTRIYNLTVTHQVNDQAHFCFISVIVREPVYQENKSVKMKSLEKIMKNNKQNYLTHPKNATPLTEYGKQICGDS